MRWIIFLIKPLRPFTSLDSSEKFTKGFYRVNIFTDPLFRETLTDTGLLTIAQNLQNFRRLFSVKFYSLKISCVRKKTTLKNAALLVFQQIQKLQVDYWPPILLSFTRDILYGSWLYANV